MENNDTRKRKRPNRKRRSERPRQQPAAAATPAHGESRYTVPPPPAAKGVGLLFWGVPVAQLDGEALRAEQERLETLWQQLEQANDPIVEHCRLGKYGKLTAAVPGFYLALKHGHYAVDSATAVVFPELADDGLQWLQAACERLALPMAEPRWYLTVAQVK